MASTQFSATDSMTARLDLGLVELFGVAADESPHLLARRVEIAVVKEPRDAARFVVEHPAGRADRRGRDGRHPGSDRASERHADRDAEADPGHREGDSRKPTIRVDATLDALHQRSVAGHRMPADRRLTEELVDCCTRSRRDAVHPNMMGQESCWFENVTPAQRDFSLWLTPEDLASAPAAGQPAIGLDPRRRSSPSAIPTVPSTTWKRRGTRHRCTSPG